MEEIDSVAFIIVKDGKFLVEKRKDDKKIDPGLVVIPGGHVDDGESYENATLREIKEETNLDPKNIDYVCALLHKSDDLFVKVNYFSCTEFSGELEVLEAEDLYWVKLNDLEKLDLEIDRQAIREYQRTKEFWSDEK